MNPISAARADLAEALAVAGYRVHSTVPEQIDPPCVILQPGRDYARPGGTFSASDYRVTVEVYLVPEYVTNAQVIDDLDQMLCDVLPALEATDWGADSVAPPQVIQANDWTAYALVITSSNYITL